MKLYYLKGACSLASYIALFETGATFEATEVDRQTRKTRDGEDYNQVNPKGYVPALRLPNGEVITENVAILQYIADLAPEKKLAPPAGTLERTRLVEWLAFINSEVHKSIGPMFSPAATDEVKAFLRANATRRLDWLETQLGNRPYLMGEQFTVADCYLFVVLGWLPHLGFDMTRWPALQAYQARIAARPAVQRAFEAEGLPRPQAK